MSNQKHIHHAIDYIEFSVKDIAQSKDFYKAAFDWKFNDYGPNYCGIQKENGEAGGFSQESIISSGGPLVVLYSQDLQSSLERVISAGGEITKEIFEFPGGKRFQFKDPSGNELAVWTLV